MQKIKWWRLSGCWLIMMVIIAAAGTPVFSQELTYHYVSKLYPSPEPAGTITGIQNNPKQFSVGWDGSVGALGKEFSLQFASGYPFRRFGSAGSISQKLTGGFYPAPVVTWSTAGLTLEETSLVTVLPGQDPSTADPVALVKIKVQNETVTKATLPLLVFIGDADPVDRESKLPGRAKLKHPLSFENGVLTDHEGNLVLYSPLNPQALYQPMFVATSFVQPVNGPYLINIKRQQQIGPVYALQFDLTEKETLLEIDSIDAVHGEKIKGQGFDILSRIDASAPQPLLIKVSLNEQDLGFIGKDGFVKEAPGTDRFLEPGTSGPWINWDVLKSAAVEGTNTLELTALCSKELTPVEDWRPMLVLAAPESQKPSEIKWPGGRPAEEWAEGVAYPYDTLLYQLSIAPGASAEVNLYVPYSSFGEDKLPALALLKFDKCLDDMKRDWDSVLARAAMVTVPMSEANDFYRGGLIDSFIRLSRPDEPGKASAYGWINGINRLNHALDMLGYSDQVEKSLDRSFSRQGRIEEPDAEDMEGFLPGPAGFSMSDNGVILWQAAEHYRLTGDRKWMEKHLQAILDSCKWIDRQRKRTKLSDGTPKIAGILPPEHLPGTNEKTYQCGYTDASNYMGLKSAADAVKEFGHQDADKLLAQAEDYRQQIIINTKPVTPDETKPEALSFPHFVPAGPNLRVPGSYGWYSVFGPVNFITSGIDDPLGDRAKWTLGFVEKYMMLCEKVGGFGVPLGVPCLADNTKDPMYSSADLMHTLDYALAYLQRDEVEKVIAAFYAIEAYKGWLSPDAPLAEFYGRYVTLLRNMLVREEGDKLRICQAVPREWFESGQKIKVDGIRTYFGGVSFELTSELVADRIIFEMKPPSGKAPKELIVRFRHPKNRPIRSVELDGQPYTNFKGEDATLTDISKPVKLVVRY